MATLTTAVFRNDLASLQQLIAAGANVNERDSAKRTPLMQAVLDNKVSIAEALLNAGADADAQDANGNTALHFAAQDYRVDAVALLLRHRVRVDLTDTYGNTALWRATFNSRGRGEIITMLRKAGADPHHRNLHGKTPLELAGTIANYDVGQFFR